MPPLRTALVGAVASFYLLEEGCHSAGFDTTIHIDITSSFHKDGGSVCLPHKNIGSMSYFNLNVNRLIDVLINL